MGVPAEYPLPDEGTSIALIAGLPASCLSNTLESGIKDNNIEYSIIRNDGSYVLRNISATDETNYFERVEHLYKSYNGRTPAQCSAEILSALENDVDYTSVVLIGEDRWNVYCANLPNSEWHLLLKISHNTLEETVNLLQRRWSFISLGGCALIVGALLLVFVGCYRLTRQLPVGPVHTCGLRKRRNAEMKNIRFDLPSPARRPVALLRGEYSGHRAR